MLFKGLRPGDEVILATAAGRGAGAGFTYALADIEAVKSTTVVVAGYKFNLKDGRGRTVPHFILPATAANRREYLGVAANEAVTEPGAMEAEDRQRIAAREALRLIRGADPADDEDIVDLIGVEPLAAFRRRWRQLHTQGQ
jgi:hypothetical protein